MAQGGVITSGIKEVIARGGGACGNGEMDVVPVPLVCPNVRRESDRTDLCTPCDQRSLGRRHLQAVEPDCHAYLGGRCHPTLHDHAAGRGAQIACGRAPDRIAAELCPFLAKTTVRSHYSECKLLTRLTHVSHISQSLSSSASIGVSGHSARTC